eukprot:1112261-Rhodomonas_salina.1
MSGEMALPGYPGTFSRKRTGMPNPPGYGYPDTSRNRYATSIRIKLKIMLRNRDRIPTEMRRARLRTRPLVSYDAGTEKPAKRTYPRHR